MSFFLSLTYSLVEIVWPEILISIKMVIRFLLKVSYKLRRKQWQKSLLILYKFWPCLIVGIFYCYFWPFVISLLNYFQKCIFIFEILSPCLKGKDRLQMFQTFLWLDVMLIVIVLHLHIDDKYATLAIICFL